MQFQYWYNMIEASLQCEVNLESFVGVKFLVHVPQLHLHLRVLPLLGEDHLPEPDLATHHGQLQLAHSLFTLYLFSSFLLGNNRRNLKLQSK